MPGADFASINPLLLWLVWVEFCNQSPGKYAGKNRSGHAGNVSGEKRFPPSQIPLDLPLAKSRTESILPHLMRILIY